MEIKTMGNVSFIVGEVIVVLGAIAVVVAAFTGVDLGGVTATHVFTLQGTIMGFVFGGAATKNFRKPPQ